MKFFSELSGRQRLFAFIFFLFIAFLTLVCLTKGIFPTIGISLVLCVMLWIARPIWLAEDHGKNLVRRLSLSIAFVVTMTYGYWEQVIQNIFKAFIETQFPEYAANYPIKNVPPALIFTFILFAIFIVNYLMRDKTAMGIHKDPIDKDIPEPTYQERLKSVVEALRDDLKSIDKQSNWSSHLFTPLDAEVEVNTSNGKEKRITDLLSAIKRSKDRLLLVLGEPGSGKSVALRKLARDLCDEAHKVQKIPVYINLKEWGTDRTWTEDAPPTVKELNDFVLQNLKNRDIVTSKFFDKYYDRLYETGRLYFIFDSFDEIPAVLDERENSELIKELSKVLFQFLKGARAGTSQGILSSRIFRKPTSEFQTNTTLEIRPFSEDKIIQTIKQTNAYRKDIVKEIFTNRLDLAGIATNPFSATLITEYIENNNYQLPANQSEMYENYIHRTLDSCADRMRKKNLSKETIFKCCSIIADEMFEHYGFELPIYEVAQKYPDLPIEQAIDILKFARLGRLGVGDENLFSFVHRRFAEYYAVQNLLANDTILDLEAIPTDSQQRDALVLYCEVAPIEKATQIANFCWAEMEKAPSPQNLRFIHCLRFLNDAFRNRKECIEEFKDDLVELMVKIYQEKNLLTMKLITESIGLLEEKIQDAALIAAFETGNQWMAETAVVSARLLSGFSPLLDLKLYNFFDETSMKDFVFNHRKSTAIISLLETFKKYYHYLWFKFSNIAISFIPFILLFIYNWKLGIIYAAIMAFIVFLSSFKEFIKIYPFISLIFFLMALFSVIIIDDVEIKEKLNIEEYHYVLKIFDLSSLDANFLVIMFLLATLAAIPFYELIRLLAQYKTINIPNLLILFKDMFKDFKVIILSLRKVNKSDFYEFVVILTMFMLMGSLYSCLYLIFESDSTFTKVLFTSLVCIIFLSIIWRILVKEEKEIKNILTKVNKSKIDRKTIYNVMNNSKYISTKVKFVNFLENNVKIVSGEYPSLDIFKLKNNMIKRKKPNSIREAFINTKNDIGDSFKNNIKVKNELITRLAKLEEKWLGLDR